MRIVEADARYVGVCHSLSFCWCFIQMLFVVPKLSAAEFCRFFNPPLGPMLNLTSMSNF